MGLGGLCSLSDFGLVWAKPDSGRGSSPGASRPRTFPEGGPLNTGRKVGRGGGHHGSPTRRRGDLGVMHGTQVWSRFQEQTRQVVMVTWSAQVMEPRPLGLLPPGCSPAIALGVGGPSPVRLPVCPPELPVPGSIPLDSWGPGRSEWVAPWGCPHRARHTGANQWGLIVSRSEARSPRQLWAGQLFRGRRERPSQTSPSPSGLGAILASLGF